MHLHLIFLMCPHWDQIALCSKTCAWEVSFMNKALTICRAQCQVTANAKWAFTTAAASHQKHLTGGLWCKMLLVSTILTQFNQKNVFRPLLLQCKHGADMHTLNGDNSNINLVCSSSHTTKRSGDFSQLNQSMCQVVHSFSLALSILGGGLFVYKAAVWLIWNIFVLGLFYYPAKQCNSSKEHLI